MTRLLGKVGRLVTIGCTAGALLCIGGCKDKDYDEAMAPEKPVKMKVWPSGHGPTMGGAPAAAGGGGGSAPKSPATPGTGK